MTVANIGSLPVDYTAALAAVGLRGNDPKAQAVVLVCQRYTLDPILKHVVLVDGNVYVTRDGLLHIAHNSGQLDGIEIDSAVLTDDGKEWQSRAVVWRKDMSRPFTMGGRYPAGRKNSQEMAEKVAEARTLKRAFDVAIATDDERHQHDDRPAAAPRVTAADIVPPVVAVEAAPPVAETAEVLPVDEPDMPGWPDIADIPQ